MENQYKNIELFQEGNFIHLKVTGKLEKEDYDFFVPQMDKQIEEHGKVNILMELIDFQGWTAGAAWEDTKFGIKHFNDIEKIAIVGDKAWEKGMAAFCKVFTMAKVRYFDANKDNMRHEAEEWIENQGIKKVV